MTGAKRQRSLVALTEDNPEHVQHETPVVFGYHVRQEAAVRSDMLSGVGNTQGLAELPGQLSPDDIRLWEAACLVDCQPSTTELVTILEVADVLGDNYIASWVDMFAKRILPAVWGDSQTATDMLCALLQLPSHLLRRVLAACLATESLEALLNDLPAILHPALVSSCVSTGTITLPGTLGHMRTVLSLLALTPSGLSKLSTPVTFPSGVQSAASAALLAHALSAQPSLTSVTLSNLILPVAFFRQLGLGLRRGALPNLTTFRASIRVHPDGCAEFVRCLKHLSALTFLTGHLYFNEQSPGGSNLGSYVGVAASPARLVNLQQLTIQEKHHAEQSNLHPSSRSVAHRLFPLIAAPSLTSLHFISDVVQGSMLSLMSSLRHMSSLQHLEIDADMSIEEPLTANAPACDRDSNATLPELRALTVTSASIVSPVAMAAAAAASARSSLTRLCMQHVHVAERQFLGNTGTGEQQRTVQPPTSEGIKQAWAGLLSSLSACAQLQDLQLTSMGSAYPWEREAGFSEDLASALQQLPLLTRLRLSAVCKRCYIGIQCQLRGEDLGKVLRGLTGLQELGVYGAAWALEVVEQERMLAVLPELQQLTSLGLCFSGLHQPDVAELIPKLGAVKECELLQSIFESDAQAAAFQAQAGFPEISFSVCGSSYQRT